MSTSTISRLTAFGAVLGLLLVSGSARAQFDECAQPVAVPDFVFDTIIDQATLEFGVVEDKVCNSIVKEGVKICKAQVKASSKCFDRAADANYKIALKQCQTLEIPEDRAACKSNYKAFRDSIKSAVAESEQSGLAICDEDFADDLSQACLGPIPI
jgi:hypothetical protein